MEEVATISFVDSESNADGIAIIRATKNQVAVCLSLKKDGDIEVFLSTQDSEKLLKALQTAIAVASDAAPD